MCLTAAGSRADTLDEVRKNGVLRWGGDEEGGGPYIFQDKDKNRVGFEVDLMNAVAERLKVRAKFEQGQWSDLPKTLDERPDLVDVIVNGFELTRGHLENGRLATMPYYVYELQLITCKAESPVADWDDLGNARKKIRVGALSGSAALTYAKKEFGDSATVTPYESTTNILDEVETGKIDAAIQDTPATVFFLKDRPKLKVVGKPIGRGFYVIYCRKDDTRLREAIDAVLLEMIRDGSLRKIL